MLLLMQTRWLLVCLDGGAVMNGTGGHDVKTVFQLFAVLTAVVVKRPT